jgi:hypothetical protein
MQLRELKENFGLNMSNNKLSGTSYRGFIYNPEVIEEDDKKYVIHGITSIDGQRIPLNQIPDWFNNDPGRGWEFANASEFQMVVDEILNIDSDISKWKLTSLKAKEAINKYGKERVRVGFLKMKDNSTSVEIDAERSLKEAWYNPFSWFDDDDDDDKKDSIKYTPTKPDNTNRDRLANIDNAFPDDDTGDGGFFGGPGGAFDRTAQLFVPEYAIFRAIQGYVDTAYEAGTPTETYNAIAAWLNKKDAKPENKFDKSKLVAQGKIKKAVPKKAIVKKAVPKKAVPKKAVVKKAVVKKYEAPQDHGILNDYYKSMADLGYDKVAAANQLASQHDIASIYVEGVGIITSQNTTDDVKPGETQRQAKKFGNIVDKDGIPPLLHDSEKSPDLTTVKLAETFRNLVK